jgi:hypothetical protein
MDKEQGKKLYSRLAWEVVAIGPLDDDEPELDQVWETMRKAHDAGEEAVSEACCQIVLTYRVGGNRDALGPEWAVIKAFAER